MRGAGGAAAQGAGTPGRTTIADIAREVGVSVPTVSKVLNGRPDVAAATRAEVEAALARHTYRRRGPARPPAGRTRVLDLVFPVADNPWAQEMVAGVELVCGPERIGVVLSTLSGSHRPPQEWLDDVFARRPLGVVFMLSGPDEEQRRLLAARSIPFVVVDTEGELAADVPTVGAANWQGGLLAARHLLSLGHRRIAVVSGPRGLLCSRARVDGFRSAVEDAGVAVDPDLVAWGGFTAHDGLAIGRRLLALPDPPTAVFGGSDQQALGIVRAADERGLRVPDDLSVVGCDDLPFAQWLTPSLTTVRQPLREMAGLATRMLLRLADGEELSSPRVELATELVVRGSTGPPGRAALDRP